MNAPFRDLFVELPTALFQVLQGIGESAVKAASYQPTPHRRSATSLIVEVFAEPGISRKVCERFGWQSYTMWRSEAVPSLAVAARLSCGHKHTFTITEVAIEDVGASAFADLFAKHAARRPCACVAR